MSHCHMKRNNERTSGRNSRFRFVSMDLIFNSQKPPHHTQAARRFRGPHAVLRFFFPLGININTTANTITMGYM